MPKTEKAESYLSFREPMYAKEVPDKPKIARKIFQIGLNLSGV
jgi:hypothetical protein